MVNRMTIDLRIEGSKIKMASDGHASSSGIPLSRLVRRETEAEHKQILQHGHTDIKRGGITGPRQRSIMFALDLTRLQSVYFLFSKGSDTFRSVLEEKRRNLPITSS